MLLHGIIMNFFKNLFKRVEDPETVIIDDTLGRLYLIDLELRGKYWEVVHNGIKLLIKYDGVNKAPTDESLSVAYKAFQGNWLESSLQSAIGIAIEQNATKHHEKINQFTITSLCLNEGDRLFIGLCDEDLWFAESVAGKIKHVWLDV